MIIRPLFRTIALSSVALGAVACGGGGGSSIASTSGFSTPMPTVTTTSITPLESVTPSTPAVSNNFSPALVSVISGGTAKVILPADTSITCTNGGVFSDNIFTAQVVTEDTVVVCSATDAAGNAEETLTVNVLAPGSSVIISGKITFDHVPFNTTTSALNYDAITQDPAPGVTVEAVDNAGTILFSTTTDGNGDYSVLVDPNTNVRIRVKAEMVQTSGAQWEVSVIDNTSSDALYALQGALATSGGVNSTRNLNARSGWGGSSYTSSRAAAPFAILAPIYESMQRVAAVDSDVVFPPTFFNWSINNRPSDDDIVSSFEDSIDAGDINTSSYIGNGRILILGSADADTDEYDEHVVIHEWGHYFEDQLSRSDSIGGEHGPGDRLDPRVALGEGFGNALSGMMTDDPFYRDSFDSAQSDGFAINVESNNYQNEGWFNEGSVQSILYDIYDDANDGPDTISAGLAPIYNVLTSASYTGNSFFLTIFNFLEEYRVNNVGDVQDINALASTQSISGTDAVGAGETNTGNVNGVLPLYKAATINGAASIICLNRTAGVENKLGNRAYLGFNVTSPGTHTLRMTRVFGASSTDPDFFTFRDGILLAIAESGANNSEVDTVNLTTTGLHIVDGFDFDNSDACYEFTVER